MPSDRQYIGGVPHLVRTNTGTPDLPSVHAITQQGRKRVLVEVAHGDAFPPPSAGGRATGAEP